MAADFHDRAERIVDALLESDPEAALWAGDHRFDGRLPNLSQSGVVETVTMLREAADALDDVDPDTLDPADAVDHEILTNEVQSRLFTLADSREQEWDPLMHNPGHLLDALLTKAVTPADERAEAYAQRLEALPDALVSARATLRDVPRIHAETAAAQFRGVAELVRAQSPALAALESTLTGRITGAAASAVTALTEFADAMDAQPDGRDPRLGKERWQAKLWYSLGSMMSAEEVVAHARKRLDEVTEEMAELARSITGLGGREAIVAALDELAKERPDNDSIVPLARQTLEETTAFVAEHDLVSLVDDPLEIITMPEYARGVAVAYCDPPGTLETAAVPTYYAISPTPEDWSAERSASFFAEYNNHMLRNLTVHEAMPGHYLQLAHSRRYRGSTRARAVNYSGTFVEGWAVYAEEFMADAGFGGDAVRMHQLKMQLRMIINALLDHGVHCEGMTEEEAMDLMTRRGFQAEGEAAGKWRRALLTSTQLSTYFVGYTEVAAIGRERPSGMSPRQWHDAMLSFGNPTPKAIRRLLGLDVG